MKRPPEKPPIRLAVAVLVVVVAVASCGGDSGGDTGAETGAGPFRPRATLKAVGETQRTAKPAFVFTVEPRPGQPNVRSATVKLPPVVLVDPTSIGRFCSEAELDSDECAGRKRLGFARVSSPAYDAPLRGPVYAVTGSGGLPRLAYLLGGPADVLLRGKIASRGGTISAGVEEVPDIPFDSFVLRIDGGPDGYLVLSRDICNGSPTAKGTFTDQGGQVSRQEIPLQADCAGG